MIGGQHDAQEVHQALGPVVATLRALADCEREASYPAEQEVVAG